MAFRLAFVWSDVKDELDTVLEIVYIAFLGALGSDDSSRDFVTFTYLRTSSSLSSTK